jgi:hypothetical protein
LEGVILFCCAIDASGVDPRMHGCHCWLVQQCSANHCEASKQWQSFDTRQFPDASLPR